MSYEKDLCLTQLSGTLEQNPQWAGTAMDEIFGLINMKASSQDLCHIRRQVSKYIDEMESFNLQAVEHSIKNQLYKDVMTAFLVYVTYLQVKYRPE